MNPCPTKPIHELRAGIIGTGFIGPVHLEALRRLGVKVTAICDTTERAQAAAAKHGIPEVHGDADYRALVNSPQVDVVHVTAPNRFHCEMALAAIKAGKHCICEKPLAMNTKETARIVAAARRAGTVFAVNYNVRFYPAVLQMRQLATRGDLGQIIHVNGSYLQDWLFKDTDYNWRLLPQEGGTLRAVADIGTHWLDTVGFILDSPVRSLLADLSTFHKTRQRPLGEVQTFAKADRTIKYAAYPVATEDFASLLLEYANGARGNLAVSQVAAGRKNCIRIEIYGTKQSVWWNSEQPNTLVMGNRDTCNQIAIRNTPAFGPDIQGFTDYPAGHNEGFPDTFKMLFRTVYGAIVHGGEAKPLFATPVDGHEEVRLCEAVIKSHRARRWVRL